MNNFALMIIDMQNDIINGRVVSAKTVVEPIKKVLEFFRDKKWPIVHVLRVHRADGTDVEKYRHSSFMEKPYLVKGTPGSRVIDAIQPTSNEYIIEKRRFSGFFQTDLLLLLKGIDVSHLVVCGVQTPNCVRCTVTDAIGFNFDVTVLEDATAAQTSAIHAANLLDMKNMGVNIQTLDAFITEKDQKLFL